MSIKTNQPKETKMTKNSKEYIKQYGKKLDYTFKQITEYMETEVGNRDSLIFALLDGRKEISDLNKEIKTFFEQQSETYTRNILSQNERDYHNQMERTSDDPPIK